ncbi:MAG: twin-arginine translocase subunit TatC [Bacteroidetes bacterium]|nr:twin-arginine translocase subunit TatC [Bacteroidota bacterium]
MSFLDHLEVLRWHLVRSVVALVIFMILVFINKQILFDYILLAPKSTNFITYRLLCRLSEWLNIGETMCVKEIPYNLINIDITGQFMTHIYTSAIGGFVLAFPYIFWEIWRFVRPALYTTEQKYTQRIVLSASALFLTGILFGYFVLAPMSILFLGSYQVSEQVSNQINLNSYVSLLSMMTLISGVIFELPLLTFILAKLGILTAAFMRKYRRHAIVVIFIFAAIITPSPDVTSQILVAIPLLILYEASIVVARTVEKRRN